jgi:hypothetical protein
VTWLEVQADAIPNELRALGWVLWRAEPSGDEKPKKVPYIIAEPTRRASSTDPTTWGAFTDAIDAYSTLSSRPDLGRGPVAGVGVVLTKDAQITCIDLDRVLVAGRLDTRAETLVERCDSWTEVSPSGTGVHVFVKGRVSRGLKGEQIEVYSDSRYICITGHQWPGTSPTLRWQQDYLDALVKLDEGDARPRRPWTGPNVPPPDDLAGALLAKLAAWGVAVERVKRWADGYLVELPACPWAGEHTAGAGGAAVMIRASGAYDFTCLHAHCGGRGWRDFRAVMERAS